MREGVNYEDLGRHLDQVRHQEKRDTYLQCEQPGCTTLVDVFVSPPFGSSMSARCREHGWDVTVRMDTDLTPSTI